MQNLIIRTIISLLLFFSSVVNGFSNPSDSILIWEKMADSLCCKRDEKAIYYYSKLVKHFKKNDDLENLLKSKIGISKIHVLKKNNKLAKIHLTESEKLAKKLNRIKELPDILNNLGIVYYREGKINSAIEYFKLSNSMYSKLNNRKKQALGAINLGILYKKFSLYEKSLKHLYNAINLLQDDSNSSDLASTYNVLANVMFEIHDTNKVLPFHLKALSIRKKLNDRKKVSVSLNNIGNYYIWTNNIDSAELYLKKAFKLKKTIRDSISISITLTNLADLYLQKGKLFKAKKLLKSNLKFLLHKKNQEGIAEVSTKLGSCYLKLNKCTLAKRHQVIGEKAAKKILNLELLKENLILKSQILEKQGEYEEALKTERELLQLKDQILDKEKSKALLNMQIKYEVDQHKKDKDLLQKKNKLQEAQIKNKDLENLLLIIGISFVSFLFIFLFFIFRQRNKHNKLLKHLIVEQQHRVKNFLNTIVSVFRMHERRSNDDKVKAAVKEGSDRLNAMLLIHKQLNNHIWENHDQINFSNYANQLINHLKQAYISNVNNVKTTIAIKDEIILEVDKAISLGLILNEVMTNAIKYAVPFSNSPHIQIHLDNTQNRLVLSVQDNGPGIPEEKLKQQQDSLGLKLIQLFSKNLNATFQIENNNGTLIKISINE